MQSLPGDREISSESEVGRIAFGTEGSLLAGLCQDEKLRLWEVASGELKTSLPWEKGDASLTLLPGAAGGMAAVAENGSIKFWDFPGGTPGRTIAGPKERLKRLGFSQDGKLVAGSGSADENKSGNVLRVWDGSGRPRFHVPAGFGGTSAIAFAPDGSSVVAAAFDTNVRAWSSRDGELLRVIDELPVSMFALAFSPDGKYLAAGGADRTVYLFDTKAWKAVRKFTALPEMVSAIAFSDNGRYLVTGGFSEVTEKNPVKVLLWDVAAGKVIRSVTAPRRVASVAFAPGNKLFASSAQQKTIRLWAVPA